MSKDIKIKKVLVLGSGPIIIGQGAEFDYAGTQACKALKEEGITVVLINSNPATIMTDTTVADRVYIQPMTVDTVRTVLEQEQPDGILATLGGQTALNLAVQLVEKGILEEYGVSLLGTDINGIQMAEDREKFKQLMTEIQEPIPESTIVSSVAAGICFAEKIGFPIIVRPAYTLGGTGGGMAQDIDSLKGLLHTGLMHSPIHQVLVEKSVAGWRELEFEVVRDAKDNVLIICSMENMDPVGIHTGDSIVVAPCQTLNEQEYQMLESSAFKIVRALGIEGGCNVQYALHPNSGEYIVIEVNPRVSRSSALASKATGYPIAKVTTKIALGLELDEIGSFQLKMDYVITKIPKWPFDKFAYGDRYLGTQMKATGEVMAIDRIFESSFLKAVISLEGTHTGLRKKEFSNLTKDELQERLAFCDDQRFFVIAQALRANISIDIIAEITKIHPWFLQKVDNIVKIEQRLEKESLTVELLKKAEKMGFTDIEIQDLSGRDAVAIDTLRRAHHIYPVYKRIDNWIDSSGQKTPYYYSTYDKVDENKISKKEKVVVIGSGPIRIGQGIEFDYCSVHAIKALKKAGCEAIMINNNPETVSTDFDIADKLYFEPLYIEDVYNVIRKEMPKGVIVQFGGQTSIDLAPKLVQRGVQILGTSMESIDAAEDRKRFEGLLQELGVYQPKGSTAMTFEEGIDIANKIGYPVLVRPSYVIGGRAMQVVYTEAELRSYMKEATEAAQGHGVLIDEYIEGIEVEVDAISDGKEVLIPGIMEHIERTGVHSGDSIGIYPPRRLSNCIIDELVENTKKIAEALEIIGLMNIQFVVKNDKAYVIEVNPRASRTVPILSKITDVPMVEIAVRVILGETLEEQGYGIGLLPPISFAAVKVPVFSFQKLFNVDVALTPEMKSTGEVLGIDTSYEKALVKGFQGAGYSFPSPGKVFVSVNSKTYYEILTYIQELHKFGFTFLATEGTGMFLKKQGIDVEIINKKYSALIQEKMRDKEVCMVLNIPTLGKDPKRKGFQIRYWAQQYRIPCFTSLDTAMAYFLAWKEVQGGLNLSYKPL